MRPGTLARAVLALALAAGTAGTAFGQAGTAFTYQAQLKDAGVAINGTADVRFTLFNASSGGGQVAAAVTKLGLPVTNGLFTTDVDFGTGPYQSYAGMWMQIEVRSPAGVGSFVALGSRQKLTPTPFSMATRGINVLNNGNVGIGTVTPVHKLHVFGTGGSNSDQPHIVLETDGGTFGPQVRLKHAGAGGSEWLLVSGGSSNSQTGNGNFGITKQGGPTPLVVTAAGNIGLGTNTPAQKLTVNGNTLLGTAANTGVGIDSQSAARLGFISKTGSLPVMASSLNNPIIFSQTNQADVLGSIDTATLTERMRIASNGNVGIGNSAPAHKLTVAGTVSSTGLTVQGTSDLVGTTGIVGEALVSGFAGVNVSYSNTALSVMPRAADAFALGVVGTNFQNLFSIRSNGDMMLTGTNHAIGDVVFPTAALTMDTGLAYALIINRGNAAKPGGGSWANISDARVKKNIVPLEGSLEKLMALRGVNYEYIDPKKIGELDGVRTGFIAQEVEKVIPDWVEDGGDGYKHMSIRGFEAMAVEALRELRAEKDAQLEALRAEKDGQIAELLARLERLEAIAAGQNAAK